MFAMLIVFAAAVSASLNVGLNAPVDDFNSSTGNINFYYTPVSNTTLDNCTLFGNFSGSWNQNQTNLSIINNTQNNFSLSILTQGNYIWNIQCENNISQINMSASNYTLNVDLENPIANATADITINEGISQRFNGSNSNDSLTGIASYLWNFNDTNTSTSVIANNTFIDNGTYVVNLTVTDFSGRSHMDFVIVTVDDVDATPVILSTINPTNVTFEGNNISFTANESTGNAHDNITAYHWNFGDGNTDTGMNTSHIYADNGTYEVMLTVEDEDSNASINMTIYVTDINATPVLNASVNPTNTTIEGTNVTFTANESTTDNDQDNITQYHWNFGDGNTATGVNASNLYRENGTYEVMLTVEDEDSNASINMTLTITDINAIPVMNASVNNTNTTYEGNNITFTANESTTINSHDNISQYHWNFGDGNTATGMNVSHIYADNGTFEVMLTVEDEDSNASVNKTMTITDVDPIAQINSSVVLITEGGYINFTANESVANNSYDPLNTTFYQWDFDFNGVFVVDENTTVNYNNHRFIENGTYTIAVRVLDEDSTDIDTINVTINDVDPIFGFGANVSTIAENANGITNNVLFEIIYSNRSYDPLTSFDWDIDGDNVFELIDDASTYTRSFATNGTYVVRARVVDEDSNLTKNVTINVTFVNDLPVYNIINNQTITEDSNITIQLLTNATDEEDAQAQLTHTCISNNANVTLSYEDVDKNLTISAINNYVGRVNISCMVNDTLNGIDTYDFTVTITEVNDAPVLGSLPNYTAVEDTVSFVDLSAYMSDTDNITSELRIQDNSSNIYSIGTLLFFNYTNASANFTETVLINITDGPAESNAEVISINVTFVNDAPVMRVITTRNIVEDSGMSSFNISNFVSDEENDAIEFLIFSENTSEVDCNINGDNITYTPAANWYGVVQDAAHCRVYASETLATNPQISNIVDMQINVIQVDDTLIHNESISNLTWAEDTVNTYDMTQSFNNIDDDVIAYTVIGNSSNITITFNSDIATFTPDANWFGERNISINATDGTTMVQSNNFTLNVTPVNDAPVLNLPARAILEDTVGGSLNASVYASDIENDNLTYSVVSENVSEVDCTIVGEILSYVPFANYTGVATCGVIANDGNANSAVSTITITVNNVDDVPLLNSNIANQSWNEDTVHTLDISGNFVDIDGDALTYTYTNVNNITISINNNTGVVTFTPDNNFFGVRYVVFTANDGTTNVQSNNVTLTVNAVNDDVPVIAAIPTVTFVEDGFNNSINLSQYVSDADNNSMDLIWTRVDTNNNVVFSYDSATGMANFSGASNFNGIMAVILMVSDGQNTDTAAVTVDVSSVEDAPTMPTPLTPVNDSTVTTQDNTLTWTTSTDPEGNAVTYYVFFGDTNTPSLNATTTATSLNTVGATVGDTYYWYVTASDGALNTTSGMFQFTFNTTSLNNSAPTLLSSIPNITWDEDTNDNSVDLDTYFNDSDGDALTYSCSNPANITRGIANGVISLIPDANFNGVRTMNCSASDIFNTTQSNEVTLTVNPVNDAPTIATIADTNATVDIEFTLQVNANDIDTGDSLSYTIMGGGPSGMTISNSGLISGWTPTSSQNGNSYSITVTVCDDSNAANNCTSDTFDIDVDNDPDFSIDVPSKITISGVSVNSSGTIDFTIENDGNSALNNLQVTLDTELLNDYNGVATPNTIATLNPSATTDITLTIDVPIDEKTTSHKIGEITVADAGNVNKVINVYLNADSFLSIEELKVKVGGKRDEIVDGETVSKEAEPGDTIEFELEVRNNYQNIDIEDVEVTIEILDIDDGDDVEKDSPSVDIDADDSEDFDLSFNIPTIVDEKTYTVLIHVEGQDDDDNIYEIDWTVYFEVEKDSHKVILDRVTVSPSTLTCVRYTDVEMSVINIGSKDEDDLKVVVVSQGLDFEESRSFELDEGDDDDAKRIISYRINVDDNVTGTFDVDVNLYMDGSLEETETVTLRVNECDRQGSGSSGSSSGSSTTPGGFDIVNNLDTPSIGGSPVVDENDGIIDDVLNSDLALPALGVLAAAAGVFVMIMLPK